MADKEKPKGKTELDTRVVTRNGVDIAFKKIKGGGDKSRENWVIQLNDELVPADSCPFFTWIGEGVPEFLSGSLQNRLNLWTHHGPENKAPDDCFFEKLAEESLVARSKSTRSSKKTVWTSAEIRQFADEMLELNPSLDREEVESKFRASIKENDPTAEIEE